MREIKFRGYSTKDNEWRYGFYVTDNIAHEILTKLENNEMYASQIDFISLGQYTGLKDVNGVEIYEGDILKSDINETFGFIAFEDGKFVVNWEDITEDLFEWTGEFVIGNIYENPELLGSENGR